MGGEEKKMKLLKFADWQVNLLIKYCGRQNGKEIDVNQHLATNKDILTSVIETCKQFHRDCEKCPYWLKNKFNCIWNAHKIIGKDVMAYWDDEIEERIL